MPPQPLMHHKLSSCFLLITLVVLLHFYRWENWGTEKLRKLTEISALINRGIEIWSSSLPLWILLLTSLLSCLPTLEYSSISSYSVDPGYRFQWIRGMVIYKFPEVWYYLHKNDNGWWWPLLSLFGTSSLLCQYQHPDSPKGNYPSLIILVCVPCLSLAKGNEECKLVGPDPLSVAFIS